MNKHNLIAVYPTKRESEIIRDWLKPRKHLLSIYGIEAAAGMYKGCLHELFRKTKTLPPDKIIELCEVLKPLGFIMPSFEWTIQNISAKIATVSNVPIWLLKSKTRERTIVEERQIAIYFCKELIKWKGKQMSFDKIGEEFKMSSVGAYQSYKTVIKIMDVDIAFKAKVDKYRDFLNEHYMK